jgi:divalent metal cation (Fe/Co/Zn/Cd) transporter
MNYRPDPMMQQGLTPPASGARRVFTVLGFISAAGLAGIGLVLALAAAQLFLPPPFKPADVIGAFFGAIASGVKAIAAAVRRTLARVTRLLGLNPWNAVDALLRPTP